MIHVDRSSLALAPMQQGVTQTQGEGQAPYFFKELKITLMP